MTERSLWLFCLVWHVRTLVYDDQSTVHLNWHLGCYQFCGWVRSVWEINRVLLRISIWFSCHFAGFHVANQAVILLLLLCRRMKSFGEFFVANTLYSRARPSTARSGQVIDSVCVSQFSWRACLLGPGWSAVHAQPWLFQRLLGLFVARCALVRNSLQTSCL